MTSRSALLAALKNGVATPEEQADAARFIYLASEMRSAQRDYFKRRRHPDLVLAQGLERKLDAFFETDPPSQEKLL